MGKQRTTELQLTFDNKIDYLRPTRTLTINLPGTIDLNDKEAKMVLASKLYELGKLTLGQAAELVGYSKETFMELLADYGVSFFNYSPEELDEDISDCKKQGCTRIIGSNS